MKETRGGLLNKSIVNGKKVTGFESVRLSDSSLVAISDSIDENNKVYVNFVSSLNSPITRKNISYTSKKLFTIPTQSLFQHLMNY